MMSIVASQWKGGILAFVLTLALCAVSIWQRQERVDVVMSFSAPTISRKIDLPSLIDVNSGSIAERLRVLLRAHGVGARVVHENGAFTVTREGIATSASEEAKQGLTVIYRKLADHLSLGVDPSPLSRSLAGLDDQIVLIGQTLQAGGLSAYEQFLLRERLTKLEEARAAVRSHAEVLTAGILTPPTFDLDPARRIAGDVLLVLSLVLSAFVAGIAMVVAESLGGRT
jgi:hypothetical protein